MSKKILVVDDEESIRELTKDLLESRGYEVLTAPDGKKGVELAKSKKPDLILMDVNMPKMDGFKALEEIKKDKKTMFIPVFMLTTRQAEDDIQQGMENYADKYLPKPFTSEKLMHEIEQTFGYKGI